MPRGKNYVNNNNGVTLQSHKKKSPEMEPCFYGAGCNRPGCIFRHDIVAPDAKKTHETCFAFLAGNCKFSAQTCKKIHPNEQESIRLRAKYKKVKCKWGDDCRTVNCLYSHPRDSKGSSEEPVAFEQNAFPSLTGDNNDGSKGSNGINNQKPPAVLPGSAWRAAPVVSSATQEQPPQQQVQTPQETAPQPEAPKKAAPQPQEAAAPVSQKETPPAPPPQTPSTPISAQAPAWFPGNPQEESSAPQPPLNSPGPATTSTPTNGGKKNLNINAKVWVPGEGFQ